MKNLDSITFIKNALNSFVKEFQNTRVRYEFDVEALVHCVEVVPRGIYYSDKSYISWENIFINDFIKSFPDQNICFFSDDALVGLNNVELEFVGDCFVELITAYDFKSYFETDEISILNDFNYSFAGSRIGKIISTNDKILNNNFEQIPILRTFNDLGYNNSDYNIELFNWGDTNKTESFNFVMESSFINSSTISQDHTLFYNNNTLVA